MEEGGGGLGVGTVGKGTGMGIGTGMGVGTGGVDGGKDTAVDGVLGVGDHGGGLGPPHDGLAGDGGGHGHVVGGVNMDGGGHLDDVLLVHGHVVGDVHATLHHHGVLDLVHLNLLLDNGGVVSNGSPKDGGHRDGKMGGGGLQDPAGVAGDKAGLSEVDLLGDDGGGLVHGGDALGLGGGGEGGGGGGGHVVDGVGHHGAGGVVLGAQGGRSNRLGGGHSGHQTSVRHTSVRQTGVPEGVLGRSEGAGQQEGDGDLE